VAKTGVPLVIVFAFQVARLGPSLGHKDRDYLTIERFAATKIWNSGLHLENGIRPAGRSPRSFDE
jgi:hypothetical protein